MNEASHSAPTIRRSSTSGMSFVRRGDGPPIVFVHGWCLNRTIWNSEEARFASSHSVVTPDLAGFGRSDGLPGPYRIGRFADDLLRLLDEEKLERAVIVGFALGAAVAMRAVAKDDSHVAGLVLASVPAGSHLASAPWMQSMQKDWPAFCQRSAEAICVQPQSAASARWLASMFWGTSLTVAMESWQEMVDFEPLVYASQIRVPTLYVHGREDRYTPVSVPQACAEFAPAARVETLPDCGHLVFFDQRKLFAAVLSEFIGGLR